jgi:hypothetical protein
MSKPSAFDPSNWYTSSKMKKKPQKDEPLSETVSDSMSAVGKMAIAGAGLTLLFGMTKGFGQLFKK